MALCVCIDMDDIDDDNISMKQRVTENPKRSSNKRVNQMRRMIRKTRREILLINIQIFKHMILNRVRKSIQFEKLHDLRKRKGELMIKLAVREENLKFYNCIKHIRH